MDAAADVAFHEHHSLVVVPSIDSQKTRYKWRGLAAGESGTSGEAGSDLTDGAWLLMRRAHGGWIFSLAVAEEAEARGSRAL